MSKSLILVKYSLEQDQYIEGSSTNISVVDLSDSTADILKIDCYKKALLVYEEKGGEKYTQEIIPSNNIEEIVALCEEKTKELFEKIRVQELSKKEENEIFDTATKLLNVRNLLLKKQFKFKNDDSVVIVWG